MENPDRYNRYPRRGNSRANGPTPYPKSSLRLPILGGLAALLLIFAIVGLQFALVTRANRRVIETERRLMAGTGDGHVSEDHSPPPGPTPRERFTNPLPPPSAPASPLPFGTPVDTGAAMRESLLFDGRDDRIRAPGLGWHLMSDLTAEAWVRNWRGPVFSQGECAVEGEPGVWISAADDLGCGWTGEDGRVYLLKTGELSLRSWTHLAMVFEGNEQRLYVNGLLKARATAVPPAQVYRTHRLELGRAQSGGGEIYGSGTLRALRISSGARYSGSFTPTPYLAADPATILAYNLSEGRGPMILNDLDHRHQGVIEGPRWIRTKDFPE